jgi:uncharacterized protein YkwD
MSARHVTARLLAVAVAAALALTASPAPVAVSAPTAGERKYQNKVFKIVNNVRANHNKVKLRKNTCLQRFANRHAERMAKQKRLFHQNLGRVMRRCGLRAAGENVARGNVAPRRIVRMWMRSPGHRANILRPGYRITGVAARKAGGQWWVAQVFGRKG